MVYKLLSITSIVLDITLDIYTSYWWQNLSDHIAFKNFTKSWLNRVNFPLIDLKPPKQTIQPACANMNTGTNPIDLSKCSTWIPQSLDKKLFTYTSLFEKKRQYQLSVSTWSLRNKWSLRNMKNINFHIFYIQIGEYYSESVLQSCVGMHSLP